MSVEQLSLRASFAPFFGGSDATTSYVAAAYSMRNWTAPPNTEQQPDSILNTPTANIMLVKNYADFVGSTKNGNDIHHQYVDFIIRTALFHRELDNATKVGPVHNALRDSLAEAIKNSFNKKIGDMIGSLPNKNSDLLTDPVSNTSNLSLASIGITKYDTYLDFITSYFLLIAKQLPDTALTSAGNLLNANINLYSNSRTMKDLIRYLIGTCRTDNVVIDQSLGDFCLVQLAGDNSANKNIDTILARVYGNDARTIDEHKNMYFQSITDDSIYLFASFAIELINRASLVAIRSANVEELKILVSNAKKNIVLKDKFAETLATQFHSTLLRAVNQATFLGNGYTTLNKHEYARKVYEDVFTNWERLNSDARDFYRGNLHLFRKSQGTLNNSNKFTGWVDLMKDDFTGTQNLNNLSELRLNLMKASQVARHTMFCHTLPFVPTSVKNLWYTDSSGNIKSLTPKSNTLRDIYTCVYIGEGCNLNGNVLELPIEFDSVKNNIADFNLDVIAIMKSAVKMNTDAIAQVARPNASFNDLYEDIGTHVVYMRDDEGKFYRMVNGNRLEYDQNASISEETCAGTQLKGDRSKCKKFVYECLLGGDPVQLSVCLDRLRNSDMFNVAQNELQNVDPDIAIRVLKTFGVQQGMDNGLVVLQSYEAWRDRVVPSLRPEVRDAILGNQLLLSYIQGVINFVNYNPAILNKNVKGNNVQVGVFTDPYSVALKKTNPFISPTGPQQAHLVTGLLLRNSASMGMVAPPFRPPFFNVASALPMIGIQAGGKNIVEAVNKKIMGNELSSDMFFTLLNNVTENLKRSGISIDELDRARVTNGIEQLKSTEKKLIDLHNMLDSLNSLADYFSRASDCTEVKMPTHEISINQLRKKADALPFLLKSISETGKCYDGNWNNKNKICSELSMAFSTLLDAASKK